MKIYVKGGAWTNAEDEVLKLGVMKYGLYSWDRVATMLPRKNAALARARWNEWLDPTILKTPWSNEEDVRLLELCQLWANQWRTISDQFGSSRTAGQCAQRFNELQQGDGGATSGAGGALTRGSDDAVVDTNHMLEGRAAVGDAADLDSFERQMFDDARGRVANTSGKKGLRKDRTEQLQESRLLTQLQKRREMREAGIDMGDDPLKSYHKKVKVERREVAHEEAAAEEQRQRRIDEGYDEEGEDDAAFVPRSVADLQSRGKRPRSPGGTAQSGGAKETAVSLGAFPDSLMLQPRVLLAPFLIAPSSTQQTVDPALAAAAAGRLPVETQRALLAELDALHLQEGAEAAALPQQQPIVAESHAAKVLRNLRSTRVSQASKKQAQVERAQSEIGWMKAFGGRANTTRAAFGRRGGSSHSSQIGAIVSSVFAAKGGEENIEEERPVASGAQLDESQTNAFSVPPSGLTHKEHLQVMSLIQAEATSPTFIPELAAGVANNIGGGGMKHRVSTAITQESGSDSNQLAVQTKARLNKRNPLFCMNPDDGLPPKAETAQPTATKAKKGKKAKAAVVATPSAPSIPPQEVQRRKGALLQIQGEVTTKSSLVLQKAERRASLEDLASAEVAQAAQPATSTADMAHRLWRSDLALQVYGATSTKEEAEIALRKQDAQRKLETTQKRSL